MAADIELPARAPFGEPGLPANGVTTDEGAADFYGNPVTDAVASYRLDATGSLYESHSPQTEVPRLASPKT